MAGKYSLTLQLQLQSPQNVAQVVNQLQKQLGAVAVNVQVKNSAKATQQINQLTAATNNASNAAAKMGDAFGVSLKRFAAFSLASRAIGVFTRNLAGAIDSAIEFQDGLVKISQITGENLRDLAGLTKEVTRLSTTFGVASNEILGVTNILAQAGLKANDLTVAINALTKTKLAPTFGDINDTAEGAVALLAQFGQGVGALETQLGALNRVAADFAVESEDLIEVIRRTGGVFKASGGDLNELLALFTSVRATTRESAESIATALKTIFTRIQRPETIQYLRQFGIELVDLDGKFVGPYEAVRRLSQELSSLGEGDIKFIEIAEQLGGYRQIGKVIPLLRQFETAERARQVALEAGNSLNEDAAKAQQSLAVQFTKTREKFLALIRGISETSSFQILVKTSLNLANALISVADALKPIIPLVTTLAAVKFAGNIGSFFGSVGAAFTRRQFGGKIHAFASGGLVPGTGNRDTVPAMLTPGEFVIRKSSVNKLGAGTLAAMNENRFNRGSSGRGIATDTRKYITKERGDKNFSYTGSLASGLIVRKGNLQDVKESRIALGSDKLGRSKGTLNKAALKKLQGKDNKDDYGGVFISPVDQADDLEGFIPAEKMISTLKSKYSDFKQKYENLSPDNQTNLKNNLEQISDFSITVASLSKGRAGKIEDTIIGGIIDSVNTGAKLLGKDIGARTTNGDLAGKLLRDINIDNIVGNVFEGMIANAGPPYTPEVDAAGKQSASATWDFPSGLGDVGKSFRGGSRLKNTITDAKTRFTSDNISRLFNKVKSAEEQKILSLISNEEKNIFYKESFASASEDAKKYRLEELKEQKSDASKEYKKTLLKKKFFDGAIQRFAVGSKGTGVKPLQGRKAYVFDFDDTLAETEARVGAEPNNPDKFSQFRGDTAAKLIDSGQATKIAAMARKRAQLGHDIYVLTARPGEPQTVDAINRFMQRVGAPAKGVIGVGNMFAGEREPGKRPGTTRLLTTGSKKAKILSQIAPNYDQTWFLDDAVENLISGKQVAGVKTVLADTKGKNIVKRFAKGGAASDTVPALLTPGEFVVNKKAAQRIGYGTLNRMNKQGVTGYAKGGPVAVKKFATGGRATGGGQDGFNIFSDKAFQASLAISGLTATLGNTETAFGRVVNYLGSFGTAVAGAITLMKAFGATNLIASSTALSKVFADIKPNSFKELKQLFGSGPKGLGAKLFGVERKGGVTRGIPTDTFGAGFTIGQDKDIQKGKKRDTKSAAKSQEKIDAAQAEVDAIGFNKKAEKRRQKLEVDKTQRRTEIQTLKRKSSRSKSEENKLNKLQQKEAEFKTLEANKKRTTTLQRQIGTQRANIQQRTASLEALTPKSVFGTFGEKAGSFAQKNARAKGLTGFAARSIQGVGARFAAGGVATGAAGAGIGGTVAAIGALAGPITIATTAFAVLNGVVGAAIDAQGRYNKAVETGNADLAAFYGSVKEAPGLFQAFDLALSNLFGNISPLSDTFNYLNSFIGGPTVTYLKENAKAQALAAKYSLENVKSQEKIQTLLNDLQSGVSTTTATAALSETGANSIGYSLEVARASQQSTITAQNQQLGNKATFLQDIGSLGGLIGESSSAKNARIETEARKQSTEAINRSKEAFNQLFPVITKSAQEYIIAGRGVDEFINKMLQDGKIQRLDAPSKERLTALRNEKQALGAGKSLSASKQIELDNLELIDKQFEDTLKMYQQQQKSIEENRKYIESLNFGFRNLNSAAQATTLGLELLTSSVETGYNAFENSAKQLEAALSNVGQSMNPEDVQNAMGTLAQTLAGYGASQEEIDRATNSFGALYTAQTEAQGVLESLKTSMMQDPTNVNPQKLKENFQSELSSRLQTQGVAQPEIDRIVNSLSNINFESPEALNKIKSGDLGAFVEESFGSFKEALTKETLGPLQERAKQEGILINLTKQRIDLEKAAIDARKQSIDIELEARKAIQEFGGPVVKSSEKLDALNKKLNLDLEVAGAGRIGSGSASDIKNIQSIIRSSFVNLQNKQNATVAGGGVGAFAGAAGLQEDKRSQLESAQQALIEYSRQRLDLIREEIEIAKKKNELEKSAAEKLLGGDVEGFIQSQQASAAASVLRSGDESLAKLFSPTALGEAFKSLEGQGLSSAQMQSAAQTALSPVGGTTRMAQVLTGTTPEEQALKIQGRDIAGTLSEAGANFADMQQMKVTAQEVVIQAAQVKMGEQMNVAAPQSNITGNPIAGFRRGGTVYANRGMFVPRGTDTVPAMLTPGEFVVNAKAAQQNLGLLSAINGGAQTLSKGGTVYARYGGWLDTIRTVADFIPFLGSGLDIGEGIYDMFSGNFGRGAGKLGMGALGMLTDIATLGSGSIIKGGLKTAGKSFLKGGIGKGKGLTGQIGGIVDSFKKQRNNAGSILNTITGGISDFGSNQFKKMKSGPLGALASQVGRTGSGLYKGAKGRIGSYTPNIKNLLSGNNLLSTGLSLGKNKLGSIGQGAIGKLSSSKKSLGTLGSGLGSFAKNAGQYVNFGGNLSGGLTKTALKSLDPEGETIGEIGLTKSVTASDLEQEMKTRGIINNTPTTAAAAAAALRAEIPASRPVLRAPQVAPRMATGNLPQIGGIGRTSRAISPMQQSQQMLASVMRQEAGGGGISQETVAMLTSAFDKFAESVQTLQSMQINIKLDPTNVNVNFNGASFLSNLTEEVRKGVLTEIKNEIENQLVIGNDGKATFRPGVK